MVIQKDEQLKDVFFVKGNSNTLYDVLIISSNQMDEKTPTVRSDLFFRTSETTAYHTVERVELEIAQETLLGCPTKKEAEQEQKSIKEAVNRMSTTQLQLASKSWQIAHEKNPAKNAAFNYITRDLPDLSEIQVMPLMEYFKLWQAQPSTIAT